MDNPHYFTPSALPSQCIHCGRERNDYQYHFAEQTKEQLGRVQWYPTPTSDRIAQLERQIAVLSKFVEVMAGSIWGDASSKRFRDQMEEAKR